MEPPQAPIPAPIPLSASDRSYLGLEYSLLFFAIPAIIAFGPPRIPFFVLLYSATVICSLLLLFDRSFDRSRLWNTASLRAGLPGVLSLWAVGVVVLSLLIKFLAPHLWLAFPREKPLVWAAVMVLYPVLSVYAQNIIYRAFIFHRYRNLFPSPNAMIWASAAAFSFAHIIFLNAVALFLTLAGGLIFAHTYHKHRSILLVSIEHSLYGCLLFTVGLGWYLYLAAAR
ncbi:MAG: CPBP family intramembrane metalloprotease [Leptolyngbya sp. PLA1]|nr:CPBP family intramembrane metalloprotease [Leptolyngbya sp. PLA1]